MKKRLLLLADIHGNFPALAAIDQALDAAAFDHILNCGDSLVYAPFPNQTLAWLRRHRVLSILGNTDRKVLDLLSGRPMKKPRKEEKRVMYSSTAAALDQEGHAQLRAMADRAVFSPPGKHGRGNKRPWFGVFHGSPSDPDEFLFAETPDRRFSELARVAGCRIVVTGHSHSPYQKNIDGVLFINPGSAGRMFDGDPRACCATIDIDDQEITVRHHRIAYDIELVARELATQELPEIYATMFRQGRKLN